MNAILSVVGKDTVGILASVSGRCAEYQANVIDVSQTVINDYFAMFMIINIDALTIEFNDFVDVLTDLGKSKSLDIHVMHEDIFNLMHKI
ncbi:MAG: ACT domain-containing protein [Erysipelotrichaceae bacterium]|nr:ACT domain-containing protein [Erysipelotrichaceae bacterium]